MAERRTFTPDASRRRLQQSENQIVVCALARAGRAHDPHGFSALDRQILAGAGGAVRSLVAVRNRVQRDLMAQRTRCGGPGRFRC